MRMTWLVIARVVDVEISNLIKQFIEKSDEFGF